MRALRKLGKALGLGLVLLLSGVGVGVLFLISPPGNKLIRRELETRGTDALAEGRLVVGDLHWNGISRLTLEEVALEDADGRVVLGFDRLELRYDLRGLLRRHVTVRTLSLEAPRVDLVVGEDGRLDLARLLGLEPGPDEPPAAWGGLPLRVELGALTVSDGAVSWRDGETVIRAVDLDFGLGGWVEGRVARVEALSVAVALEAPVAGAVRLDGALGYTEGDLRLDALALAFEHTTLRLDGGVARVETAPRFDLVVDLQPFAAADLERLVGQPVLHEDVRGTIAAQGPLGALALTGQLAAPAGLLDLDAELNLSESPLQWRLDLETAGFDLHRLLVAVTEPTHLDGRYALRGVGTSWPEALDVDLEVAGRKQVFWGEKLDDLALAAHMSKGVVEIARLEARHSLGVLDLRGQVDVPAARASGQARASLPNLSVLSRFGVEGVSGGASLAARVDVAWGGPSPRVELDGTVSGAGVGYAGMSATTLTGPVALRYAGDELSLGGGLVFVGMKLPGAAVREGEIAWTFAQDPRLGSSADATIAVRGVDAGRVGEWPVGMEELSGTLSFDAPPEGPRRASAELIARAITVPPGRVASGPIRASLEGDRVVVSAALDAVDGPVLGLDAHGDLAGGRWDVERLELAPTPEVVWRADAPIHFALAEGGARDLALALSSSAGRIVVYGDAVVAAPDLHFDVQDLDVGYSAFIAQLVRGDEGPEPVSGRLDLKGHLGLADDFPTVAINLRLRELGITGGPQGLDLALEVHEEGRLARLEGELSREGARWLRLGGEVPLGLSRRLDAAPDSPEQIGIDCDRPIFIRMIAGPLDRDMVIAALPAETPPLHAASADLRLSGPACDPDVELVAAAVAEVGEAQRKVRLDVQTTRQGSELLFNGAVEEDLMRRLRLEGGGQTEVSQVMAWALRGAPLPALATPDTWLHDGSLSVQSMAVPLSAVATLLGLGDMISGDLGGGVNLSGSASSPSVAGALLIEGGRLGSVNLDAGQLMVLPADGGYTIAVNLDFADQGSLALQGFVPLVVNLSESLTVDALLGRPGLAMQVEGEGLPMAALVGVVPGVVSAEGLMRVTGEVTGTLLAPEPRLRFQSEGAKITYAGTEVEYTVGALDLDFTRDLLHLKDVAISSRPRYGAGLRRGSLEVSGVVVLDAFSPRDLDLSLDMDEFWATATSQYLIALTGQMAVGGVWPALKLSGPLALAEGRISLGRDFFLDVASLDLAPEVAVRRATTASLARAAHVPEFYEGFDLDVDLDLRRNLRLVVEMPTASGYGQQFADLTTVTLDAEFDGEVELNGQVGDPRLHGRVETVRGTANLMGVTFQLDPEGSLSFVSDDIANPLLDMRATRTTGGYGDVNVGISGDVAHMALDFSSPEYPDPSDVMSLLLFGKPTSDMSDSEGQAGAAILGAALSSVTGQVERLVGLNTLDQFEIDPSAGAVRVGKALSDTLFLSLQLAPAAEDTENRTQATVEWLIQRRLYAEFVTGDRGQSSADLYWRWRF